MIQPNPITLPTGSTYYASWYQGANVYDFTAAALTAANGANAAIGHASMTVSQIPSQPLFTVPDPTGLPAGSWTLILWQQTGGAPSFTADRPIREFSAVEWDGAAQVRFGATDRTNASTGATQATAAATQAGNANTAATAAATSAASAATAAAAAASAAAAAPAALLASTISGISVSTILKRINWLAKGKASVTKNDDGTLTIHALDEDNATELFTITFNETTGART